MEYLRQFWHAIKRFWKKTHMNQILMLVASLGILFILIFFAYMASTANIQSLKDGLAQSTVIYDKNGEEASKVSANRSEDVIITEIPKHVQDAVISIEDHRFYEHGGFDVLGITRAFFKNLIAGRITGGGSSITQQLTKNALLTHEQTYKRKIEEIFLAVEIEKMYEKDEILEMYLNQVYFGSGAWGVQNAALKYYNKDITEVTIGEAAMLAGLLKAPSALDPHKHYDKAINRRDIVLGQMKKYEVITDEEYNHAINEEIAIINGGGDPLKGKYPYYLDAILQEASSLYGVNQEEILTRGYQIYTEMDQNLQTSLESVNERDFLFPQGNDNVLVQSGSVLLDPTSGGIRALVGGRGEHVFRGFNRATQLKNQPGSTLKPIVVYTPALEEGYKYNSMLVDEPTDFGGYKPDNFSKTYEGEVTMSKAIEDSINIPAVWLLNEIGISKGLDALKRFGIPLDEKEDRKLGIALGGLNTGVSPMQMAEAYGVFANGGKRKDSHIITKIVGPTENIIAEHVSKETRVTSKKVANDMTSMLLDVVETGTGRSAKIPGQQIAGKTGSTQLSFSNGTKDQWFVGYTPNLVGAVWIGYDKTDAEHYLQGSSSSGVTPIFKAIMEGAIPHIEPASFKVDSINEQEEKKKEESWIEKGTNFNEQLKEESKKWKETLKEGKDQVKNLGEKLRGKWREITDN